MSVVGQGRGEPVPQSSDFVLGGEVEVVESNACRGAGRGFLGGAPVQEVSFGNRRGEGFGCRDAAKGAVVTLKELDIPLVRGGPYCNHKVINVG